MIPAPSRRVAIIRACVLVAALGSSLVLVHFLILPAMRGYLAAATDRADGIARLGVVMAWLSLSCAGLSIYLLTLGIRVLRQGRWPLPTAWVFRDTPVQRGVRARLRGSAIAFCGLIFLVCAILAVTIPPTIAAAT